MGVQLQSKSGSLFKRHYEGKAKAARIAISAVFSLNSVVGPIDPVTGKTLYLAQVDPHLTAACDGCVDTEQSHLRLLESTQETFIRRFMGLGDKALTAFLFTETGLWPIAYRRLSLAVRYLEYLISLPEEHLAKKATRASSDLARGNPDARGWYAGLTRVLENRADFRLPLIEEVSEDTILQAQAAIRSKMLEKLKSRLKDSPKAYLVRDVPIENEKGQVSKPVLYLRHYLTVVRRSHRFALTKLLLSDHSLASERMRWTQKDSRLPRDQRLCRVCGTLPETPEHILFVCKMPQSTGAERIRKEILAAVGSVNYNPDNSDDACNIIRRALRSRHTTNILAELAYTTYTHITKL